MNGKKQIDVEKLIDSMLEDIVPAVAEQRGRDIPEPEKNITFSPKHEEKMKKLFQKERRSVFKKKVAKYSKRAALFLVGAVLISGITIMSVEAWRVRVLNYFLNIAQERTEMKWTDENKGDSYATDEVALDYIPQGFQLERSVPKREGLSLTFRKDELNFHVNIYPLRGTLGFDTEDAEIKKVTINGAEGTLSIKKDLIILVWNDAESAYLISGNISEEEIIKIAENLKK
ncbi:MAG TPA: hypothetical protein DD391_07465 [Clostridiales bacterium]|nr:DUF4367 domain-containing protein [Clostridiales bacterium]HBL82418.1 hypothetical protein [Clostridiales bacterium]